MTYLGSGDSDPQLTDYYPEWLDNLAGDVTLEGDNGWLEDYTAGVRGEPIKKFTVVTRDAAGQTQRVVGNYRPRSTLLLLSRLLGEKFAGTPYGGHFLASEP